MKGESQMLRKSCINQSVLRWLLLPLVPVLMLVPSACKPQETSLPFETVERREWVSTGQVYKAREPGVIVIARPEDVASLNDWVTEDAKAQLQALDYTAYFALVVFQGWKGTDGYSIQIERITRREDDVAILVLLQEPRPDERKNDIVTSPYHLVQVQKVGAWDRDITFTVVEDETTIALASHNIP